MLIMRLYLFNFSLSGIKGAAQKICIKLKEDEITYKEATKPNINSRKRSHKLVYKALLHAVLISTVAYTTQREDCDAARVRKKAMS